MFGPPKDLGPIALAAGRKRFVVDLGHPIIVISAAQLHEKDLLRKKKESLRRAIELGAQTVRFAQMHTPFFYWFNVTIPGGYIFGDTNPDGYNGGANGWVGTPRNMQLDPRMMAAPAPGLVSAALLFRATNSVDLLKSLGPIM